MCENFSTYIVYHLFKTYMEKDHFECCSRIVILSLTHIHRQSHIRTHTLIHTLTYTQTYTHSYTHTYTNTHTLTHTHIHKLTHTLKHSHINTQTHTHSHFSEAKIVGFSISLYAAG